MTMPQSAVVCANSRSEKGKQPQRVLSRTSPMTARKPPPQSLWLARATHPRTEALARRWTPYRSGTIDHLQYS